VTARRGALIAAAVAVPMVALAAQASGAMQVQLDVGAMLFRALQVVGGLLFAALLWFLRRLIASIDGFKEFAREKFESMEKTVVDVREEVRTVNQELFGATGDNGMRSEVRAMKDELSATSTHLMNREVLLARLADKAGVPFDPVKP
jgi:hypothetical protein